jgi:hypothetical protein
LTKVTRVFIGSFIRSWKNRKKCTFKTSIAYWWITQFLDKNSQVYLELLLNQK